MIEEKKKMDISNHPFTGVDWGREGDGFFFFGTFGGGEGSANSRFRTGGGRNFPGGFVKKTRERTQETPLFKTRNRRDTERGNRGKVQSKLLNK